MVTLNILSAAVYVHWIVGSNEGDCVGGECYLSGINPQMYVLEAVKHSRVF